MQDLNSLNSRNLRAELAELDRLVASVQNAEARLGYAPNDYSAYSVADLRSRLSALQIELATRAQQADVSNQGYASNLPYHLKR